MKKILVCLIVALATILAAPNFEIALAQKKERKAEQKPSPEAAQLATEQIESALKVLKERQEIASKLKFQQGVITLKDGLATLKVPENFRYLDPDQTDIVLVQLWGNPPREEKTLGMLFPAEGTAGRRIG